MRALASTNRLRLPSGTGHPGAKDLIAAEEVASQTWAVTCRDGNQTPDGRTTTSGLG
ncbi:hypothetical protein GCM10009657_05280 [Oryzihumus leptocrescens]